MGFYPMWKCSFALFSLSLCAWAQSLPIDNPSDPVVAELNGRKITKSEYQKMADAQDATMKAMAQQQPKAFLEQYALYESVLAAAEKVGWTSKALSKSGLRWLGAKFWFPD